MATFLQMQTLALALPSVVADLLDEQAVFRFRRTIFAAADLSGARGTLRLDAAHQASWVATSADAFSVANGAWGRHGWTHVALQRVEAEMLSEVLFDAWQIAAPKHQADRTQCLANALEAVRYGRRSPRDYAAAAARRL